MKTYNRFISVALILNILSSTSSESRVEGHLLFLDPVGFVKDFLEVIEFVETLESHSQFDGHLYEHKKKPAKLLVQSVVEDTWNNLIALLSDPSWETFSAVAVDIQSYYVMPLEGGYFAPEAFDKYHTDERAYVDAGISDTYLFKQSTNIFKDEYWKFFGIWSRVTEEALQNYYGNRDAGTESTEEEFTADNPK